MTLTRLVIFAAVARNLSLTRASEEVGISQPTISQHLKLLEHDYQLKLYRRKAYGIELTEEGHDFLQRVASVLREINKLKRSSQPPVSAINLPSLVVGSSHGPGASLLPSLLAIFQKDHPSVSVTLKTNTSRRVERMVASRQTEIAVISRPARPSFPLVSEPFRKEKLVAFVLKNHPLTRKRIVNLPELLRAPLVVRKGDRRKGPTERLLADLQSQGLRANIAMRTDSTEAVKAAVKKKMGVGILYRDVIDPEVKKGDFQVVKVPNLKADGRSFIIYHRDRPLSASALAFLTLMRGWRERVPQATVEHRGIEQVGTELNTRSPSGGQLY